MKRLRTAITAIAITGVALVPAAQATAPNGAADREYIPFVTDFPKPVTTAPPARAAGSGVDWGDAAAAGGAGAAAVAILAASTLVRRRRVALRAS
jgi:uncharacterized protein (TIGR03382 family)